MDKKLEARIAKLERALKRKNESTEDEVAHSIYEASDKIRQIVNDLCKTLAYSDTFNYKDADMALQICENSFSQDAYRRLSSILNGRMNGKNF